MITSQTASIISKSVKRDKIFKEIAISSSNGLESCLIDKDDDLIRELKELGYVILRVDGYYNDWYRCVWGEEALKIKNLNFFEKYFQLIK